MEQRTKTKVYEAPKLVRYGHLVEVTLSLSQRQSALDGGAGSDMKTA
jgi:hypothetical protein